MAVLDIEKLYANPDARIVLVHPGNKSRTVGLIETDFGFDISSLFESGENLMAGTLTRGANAVANTVGMDQMVIRNIRETIAQWRGSTKPVFPVTLTIISYNPSIRPLDIVKEFLAGVTYTTKNGLMFGAPNGYSVTKATGNFNPDTAITGTWTLQIGQWFRATSLILVNVSTQYSKEIARSTGQPLWAKVQLSFTPAYLPDEDHVRSWFIK
ncbi:hypothetical protein [Escherichia phage EP_H11]|nr:hypothetical protein [Escherichia phage EP_H11]